MPVQDEVLRDPTNAAAGSIPYRRQIFDGDQITSSRGNFANYALYIQDAWRPTPRATVTLGLRVDWVKRHDDIFDIDTQDSVDIGPRLGLNYMLTSDQRNAVRVSCMRAHDAPSINQLLFAAGTNTLGSREVYDLDRNGSFESVFPQPASTALNSGRIFDPDYHQPYVDEWAAGYRRQFAGRTTVDVGYIHRDYRDRPALVETNAIYDGNVFKGYSNEAQNDIFLLTTNEWNYPVYNALEILATKQTSQFQLRKLHALLEPSRGDVAAERSRVVHPARRVSPQSGDGAQRQPGCELQQRSEPGHGRRRVDGAGGPLRGGLSRAVEVQRGDQLRAAGAPVVRSDHHTSRQPTRAIRADNGDAVERPGRLESAGHVESLRLPHTRRGPIQVAGAARDQSAVGRDFDFPQERRLQVAVDFYNVGNLGRFQGFLAGANQLFNTNYGKGGSLQQPFSSQVSVQFFF